MSTCTLQVANSWRTTAGLTDQPPATWDGIIRGLDNNAGLGRFAGPGGWNNMDQLVVCTLLGPRVLEPAQSPQQPAEVLAGTPTTSRGHSSLGEKPLQGLIDCWACPLQIGEPVSEDLTIDEMKSHFALWAIAKSPLVISSDLRCGSQAHRWSPVVLCLLLMVMELWMCPCTQAKSQN